MASRVRVLRIMVLGALVAAVAAGAGESTETMMEMGLDDLMQMDIDVAGAKSENIFRSVSVVSVVDRETIERYSFGSVAEVVEAVAGVTVSARI